MKTVSLLSTLALVLVAVSSVYGFATWDAAAASAAGRHLSSSSGPPASTVRYTLSADGSRIDTAEIVLAGDQTGKVVRAGFDPDDLSFCTLGIYDVDSRTTTATCAGYRELAGDVTGFTVSVSR